MDAIHYIGFDVHQKKSVSFCVKQSDGAVIVKGRHLPAEREDLRRWSSSQERALVRRDGSDLVQRLDLRHPEAVCLAVGDGASGTDEGDRRVQEEERPVWMRAGSPTWCAAICCRPATWLPPAGPGTAALLRYRNLVVQQSVRMQNKIAGLLMECGATYNKARLHGSKYFQALLGQIEECRTLFKQMLRLSRGALDICSVGAAATPQAAARGCRVACTRRTALQSIGGIGEVTALTWALEIADPHRFGSVSQAVSYCGLTAALPLLGRQTATRSDLQSSATHIYRRC